MTGPGDLSQHVARSLNADPDLLPYLPELVQDLEELGAREEEILEITRPLGLPEGTRALDLGCGKGAIALALAESLGFDVTGVDAIREFVEHANRKAYRLGIDPRCRFEVGDVRDAVSRQRGYRVVCLLSLGPVLGDPAQTVGALRQCADSGGYILIDDCFLQSGSRDVPGYEDYHDHDATLRLLQSHGDRLTRELMSDGQERREWNAHATRALVRRAEDLANRQPALRDKLMDFAESHRRETELLTGPVVPSLWLIEKA